MKTYQDKKFRHIVKYAYSHVPIYHEKYKKAGIHPSEIRGITDCHKLPLISKNDLRKHYPTNIKPNIYDESKGYILSTSGSTGKPVFIYYDQISALLSLLGYVRILKAYGGNWRKSKIMLIIDLEEGSIEHTMFSSSVTPLLKKIMPMQNIAYVHIGDKPENIIQKLHQFQPDFLGSDPNMLRNLAHIQHDTYHDDLQIKTIFSGGSMLDAYTKSFVEKTFQGTVYNLYGCTEAGALAFECIEKGYHHVHSDLVYLEFVDNEQKPVAFDQRGALIVTKLYGKGTPIIRYTGIEDYVKPIEKQTHCGITTQMIGTIQGRKVDMIKLPNNKTLTPLTITGIPSKVMEKYNSYKIKQFQIIQPDLYHINVFIVIKEHLRDTGIPVETLFHEMKQMFNNLLGPEIKVEIIEIDEIQKNKRSDYVQVVISQVH